MDSVFKAFRIAAEWRERNPDAGPMCLYVDPEALAPLTGQTESDEHDPSSESFWWGGWAVISETGKGYWARRRLAFINVSKLLLELITCVTDLGIGSDDQFTRHVIRWAYAAQDELYGNSEA